MEGAEEFALEGMEELLTHSEHAPRAVLLVVFPYQLRRVLPWMSIRGCLKPQTPSPKP